MRLLRRLYCLIRLRRSEANVAEEIEFHRAMKKRDLQSAGLSDDEASAAVTREMGNIVLAREDARGVWLPPWLESVSQDVAYALRNQRRQPGFTLAAVATLAAGIGLNTSFFTVFEAAALRPWPVRDPGRVVNVYAVAGRVPHGFNSAMGFSLPEARFLDSHSRAFSGLVAVRQDRVRFGSDAGESPSNALIVTGNYFRVLDVAMERGRGFLLEEDQVDAAEPVAVLSYLTWQNRFGADPEIIGKTIRLDNVPFTVVGVAWRDFAGTEALRTDVWIPFAALPVLRPLDTQVPDLLKKPGWCCSAVAGRLASGVNREQARAEIELLSRSFQAQYSQEPNKILLTGTAILSHPGTKAKITTAFALMFAGVTLVLLLACANVGNLLLARSAARQREIATRLALGASRRRLIRQLLTESLVLSCAAGSLGVAIAYLLPSYVLEHITGDPLNLLPRPDMFVLGFSLLLSMVACLFFGLAPALHATRVTITGAMKEQALRSRLTLRSALLSVQVALSVILIVSAGLMVRGVQRARTLDPGFPVHSITVISFNLPANSYTPARIRALVSDLRQGLASLPNLPSYGLGRTALFGANGHWFTSFCLPGEDSAQRKAIESQEVAGDYFGVLRMAIVAGRDFEPSDAGRHAILINETMALRYFASRSPIGKTILVGSDSREIIGVVKDARLMGLDAIEPLMFEPVSGRVMPQLLLRGSSPEAVEAAAAVARHLDRRIQTRVEPLSAQLDRYLSPARIGAVLAGMLGLLALALASVGIFGVFAYVVRQRTQEIGIRMALGAKPAQIIGLVFSTSFRSLLIGLVLGLLVSAAATRVLHRFLYGMSELDPVAYGHACLVLLAAAIAATWVPARRAIRVDPVHALHYE